MLDNNVKKRVALVPAILFSLCFIILSVCIYKTAIIPGVNTEGEGREDTIVRDRKKKETVEGIFVDRNLVEITSHNSNPGEAAEANYPESLGYLIGYNSDMYGTSGLRDVFYDYLYDGGDDHVGATIKLTIDAKLQNRLYELLDETVGSISVIDADTGEILVLASRGDPYVDFNINKIEDCYEEGPGKTVLTDYYDLYNSIDEFWYNRAVFAQDPPGSCAKIITATSLVENDLADLTYYDEGQEVDGRIVNFQGAVYEWIDLKDALNYSINTYFANAGLTLGAARLKKTYNNFMVGEDVKLDFTTLHSTFAEEELDRFNLASIAYGQGDLIMSPLHLAMAAATLMNDGVMMKPYVVSEVTDEGKAVYTGKPEVLNEVVSKEVSETMRELLNSNAYYYGFYDEFNKNDVFLIAKTGTAEKGSRPTDHIYFTVGAEINGHRFGICIDNVYSYVTGYSMMPKAVSIINNLIDLYSY